MHDITSIKYKHKIMPNTNQRVVYPAYAGADNWELSLNHAVINAVINAVTGISWHCRPDFTRVSSANVNKTCVVCISLPTIQMISARYLIFLLKSNRIAPFSQH